MTKKEDPVIDGLEVDDFGKPVYLHSRECGGYCDYACNTPQGDQVAEALEGVRILKSIVESWERDEHHDVPLELIRSARDFVRKTSIAAEDADH